MKVVTVVGARPQFIKAAPVSRTLRRVAHEVLVHTGQHYDPQLSDVFFAGLGIPAPDYHLNAGSGTHGAQTGEMLRRVEEVLLAERPDACLVYGDTNSTLAGALAAAKLHIPVAHVEAGLRSFNRRMPEEVNRVLADHVSTWLFCPTPVAVENLVREGITAGVHLVGDVMYDAVLLFAGQARQQSTLLDRLGLAPGGYVLATVHRAENTDDPARLAQVVAGLAELALPVLWPVHPRTRGALAARPDLQRTLAASTVRPTEPLSYLDMLQAEHNARLILTDSGGVQKEAYWLGIPCVTLRDETEWVETLADGWNRLAGASATAIREAVAAVLASPPAAPRGKLHGDGAAAAAIVQHLTRA